MLMATTTFRLFFVVVGFLALELLLKGVGGIGSFVFMGGGGGGGLVALYSWGEGGGGDC